ncbi:hypothetical protein LCGC14_0598670 [marine sediment metagenome]|uniref:Uncharacterized protein n=1 Tax=marine sediment metagenome TaxID=412755 RepID=A0A0F9RG35_9ZZZZ
MSIETSSDIETVEGSITPTEGIAQSLINYYADGGKKARYLSYLVAGFSTMESVTLAKVHLKSVKRWREEGDGFCELEKKALGDLRRELSNQLIDIEFTRNFRLVLAKDFQILFKDAQEKTLTEKEQEYLLVIRKFYTPEQLTRIRQLVSGKDNSGEAFDFTKTVLTIRLEREEKSIR